jgi:hypothetical protein
MATPSLENEFDQYWSKLSIIEKQSLLTVAKNYVELKEEAGMDIEEYNKEIDDAVRRVEAGEYLTHEDVIKMSKDW